MTPNASFTLRLSIRGASELAVSIYGLSIAFTQAGYALRSPNTHGLARVALWATYRWRLWVLRRALRRAKRGLL